MDGLSSDDDEVQFTGTLDADAARERDRAAAEASGNAFDLCSQESTPAQGQDTDTSYMAYFAGRRGSTAAAAAAEPDTDGEDASPFVGGGGEAAPPLSPRRQPSPDDEDDSDEAAPPPRTPKRGKRRRSGRRRSGYGSDDGFVVDDDDPVAASDDDYADEDDAARHRTPSRKKKTKRRPRKEKSHGYEKDDFIASSDDEAEAAPPPAPRKKKRRRQPRDEADDDDDVRRNLAGDFSDDDDEAVAAAEARRRAAGEDGDPEEEFDFGGGAKAAEGAAGGRFAVGDEVEAQCPGWGETWYDATIERVLARKYEVRWTGADRDKCNVVDPEMIRARTVFVDAENVRARTGSGASSDASADADADSSAAESEDDADRPRELRGRELMTCACCRWRGKPKYGSSENGFRDGYCQPVDNFSRAVRRGDYGKYMTEPFCLEEHASQQTDYVNRVLRPKVTQDDGGQASCDDDDDDSAGVGAADDGGSYRDGDGSNDGDSSGDGDVEARVRAMPTKDLKAVLAVRGVSTVGMVEKSELVAAYVKLLRAGGGDSDSDGAEEVQEAPQEQEEEEEEEDDDEEYAEATPLGVSYEKRETVKALGAWWNAATRNWMAPEGGDRKKFAPWVRVTGSKRYLCHPFSKNEEVKREVGARFDGSRRKWYIPEECLCARNLDYCRSRGWLA